MLISKRFKTIFIELLFLCIIIKVFKMYHSTYGHHHMDPYGGSGIGLHVSGGATMKNTPTINNGNLLKRNASESFNVSRDM